MKKMNQPGEEVGGKGGKGSADDLIPTSPKTRFFPPLSEIVLSSSSSSSAAAPARRPAGGTTGDLILLAAATVALSARPAEFR